MNDKDKLEVYSAHKKQADWNKLFMGLSFFHAILLERTRHGSIGWNGICEFTNTDFELSKETLYKLLEESTIFPFEALKKTTLEVHYGIHVFDPKDKDYLQILLEKFYNDNVIYSNVHFCQKDDSYYIPTLPKIQDYVNFIESVTHLFN
jgi:dynein heavy chain